MVALPLPRGSNPQEFRENGDERLINCFAEMVAEKSYRVRSVPGYAVVSDDAAQVNCRGAIEADGLIYVVWEGGKVQSIDAAGARTDIGHIGGSGPVMMARNAASPFEIGVVVPETGRYYVISNGAVSIVDTRDLPAFNSICWVAGYFVLGCEDGRFFSTGINSANAIGGLDFASAEGNPDGLVTVFANRLELVLFGTKTIEFWGIDSSPPATGSPFLRLGGAVLNKGCGSAFSVAAIDNSFMWVGDDGVVYRNKNYTPIRVSHYGVERSIAALNDKTQIRASSYSYKGNEFYKISASTFTWVFNAATSAWHEEKSYLSDRLSQDVYVEAFGGVYSFTKINATMYRMDDALRNEGTSPLPVVVRFNNLFAPYTTVDSFEVDFITGRAPITGASQETGPIGELLWSDDGGAGWSTPRKISIGSQGQYTHRFKTRRLGQIGPKFGRRFELRISDPHPISMRRAAINEP